MPLCLLSLQSVGDGLKRVSLALGKVTKDDRKSLAEDDSSGKLSVDPKSLFKNSDIALECYS